MVYLIVKNLKLERFLNMARKCGTVHPSCTLRGSKRLNIIQKTGLTLRNNTVIVLNACEVSTHGALCVSFSPFDGRIHAYQCSLSSFIISKPVVKLEKPIRTCEYMAEAIKQ